MSVFWFDLPGQYLSDNLQNLESSENLQQKTWEARLPPFNFVSTNWQPVWMLTSLNYPKSQDRQIKPTLCNLWPWQKQVRSIWLQILKMVTWEPFLIKAAKDFIDRSKHLLFFLFFFIEYMFVAIFVSKEINRELNSICCCSTSRLAVSLLKQS